MVNKKYILWLSIFIVVLLIGSISAANDAHVAYIYKSKSDKNILNLFSNLRLKVDLIKESSLPMDLSDYKFVFVGDENFAKDIPIDEYPIVIMNHYIPKKTGLVDNVGISQLVSNKPLFVNFQGRQVKVYNAYKDNRGASLSYYYLDNANMAASLEQYLGTYSTSSGADFGTVSAFGSSGDVLDNGDVLKQNICFFGITRTDYWSNDAVNFFKDCVKYVFDYTTIPPETIVCSKDFDCGANQLIGLPSCSNNNVFRNFISFKCNNPGINTSYCTNQTSLQLVEGCADGCSNGKCNAVSCTKNSDCDDGNFLTEDVCVKEGTTDSICIHNIYTNVTQLKLVSFVATLGINFVTLNFSATQENDSVIRGYLLSKDRENWILVSSPATGYVFEGLNEGTAYVFYAKAIDINGINSEEMSISVITLSSGDGGSDNGGGSGGGGGSSGGGGSGGGSIIPISGSFSYCTIKWECSSWSECKDGKQIRACSFPAGKCTPEGDKPIESQSCIETIETESNNVSLDAENPFGNESEKSSNLITGAAIADFVKSSWLGAVIVLAVIAGIGYWFFKRK